MMKNTPKFIAAIMLFSLFGCNGIKTYTPSEIKENGENLEGKKVYVEGEVIRVAYPAGKGMLLADKDNKTIINVRVGGKVDSFKPYMMGKDINIKGIVKKREITKEDVARMDSILANMDTTKFMHNPMEKLTPEQLDSLRKMGKRRHHELSEKDSAFAHHRHHHMADCDSAKMHHGMKGGHEMWAHKNGPRNMNPMKAKHMKERNEEIKNWMKEHNSDVYPSYYIEIIRINTPEKELQASKAKHDHKRINRKHRDHKKGRINKHHKEKRHSHQHGDSNCNKDVTNSQQ